MIKDNPELSDELETKIMEALAGTSDEEKQAIEAKKKAEAKAKKESDDEDDDFSDMDFDEELPDDFAIEED